MQILQETDHYSNELYHLFRYSQGYFMYGQQYKSFSKMTTLEQIWTRTSDKFLDKSEINANVKVVRLATSTFLFGKGKRTATFEALLPHNYK